MSTLLVSYFVTTLSSWTIAFLIPLYVYELTSSPIWTSTAFFASMAPYILVTPFAGVWSDRYNKRKFLIGADLINIVICCLIYGALHLLSEMALSATLLVLSFILASVAATHHPVFQSVAPSLVEEKNLHQFNAIVNAIDNFVRVVAPISVASILAVTSKEGVLVGSIVGFVISVQLCTFLPDQGKTASTTKSVVAELRAGFIFLIKHRELLSFVQLFFFCNFGFALIGASLIYIYTNLLAVPISDIGYYYGLIGSGAVLGSALGSVLVKRCQAGILIKRSCLVAGIFTLGGTLTIEPRWLSLFLALSTCCQSIVVVAFFTYRQHVVPQAILGRTVGITRLISYLAIPPASLLSGWLLRQFSSSTLILALGGVCIVFASVSARMMTYTDRPADQIS